MTPPPHRSTRRSTPTWPTWNETDAAKRAALDRGRRSAPTSGTATRCWRPTACEAYDGMIAAVQAQMPGLVMSRTSPIDAHRDLVRFNWALGAPGADPVVRRRRRRQVRRRRQAAPHHRLRRRDDRRRLMTADRCRWRRSATAAAGDRVPRGRRPAALGSYRGRELQRRRRDAAGLAGGPPPQPDGPGARRRRVDAAPQLRRDRQVEAVTRARAGPGRAPRGPVARTQLHAAGRRVRPPLPADAARRRRAGHRARRAVGADPGPRPVPGHRRRPRAGTS